MDRACSIEARLRACVSTGPSSLTKSDRWILSEWLVARDRVLHFEEPLLHHRQKTPYAEVDLILGSRLRSGPVTVIEVKSVSVREGAQLWAGEVVSRRQFARLEKARWFVELKSKRPTRLLLATVEAKLGDANPLIRYFEAPF